MSVPLLQVPSLLGPQKHPPDKKEVMSIRLSFHWVNILRISSVPTERSNFYSILSPFLKLKYIGQVSPVLLINCIHFCRPLDKFPVNSPASVLAIFVGNEVFRTDVHAKGGKERERNKKKEGIYQQ